MKRISALAAALALLVLPACSSIPKYTIDRKGGKTVEISLWTYPVGGWGEIRHISPQLASFQREYRDIRVTVKTLDYTTGDSVVEEAVSKGEAPDIILEGPERLVANWGARGLMADINDLWEAESASQIYENVKVACHDAEGNYYIYPMCMTTHCMAINKDLFIAADAWQYVNEEEHTWTTEDFFNAVQAIQQYKQDNPDSPLESAVSVYCAGQGGDQGTRALVNNLYSGTFTNKEHTAYTVESEENIRALRALYDAEGITFDDTIVGGDEVTKFCKGQLAMSLCWNVSMEATQTIAKSYDFEIFPMTFPTDDGEFNLQGGIWGFGIFDNGDEARLEAAKTLIRYLALDNGRYAVAVGVANYLPVRPMPGMYDNDKLMNKYDIFSRYLGDYYQVTPGWADARTAWWQMLAEIGGGTDAKEAVHNFTLATNKVSSQ